MKIGHLITEFSSISRSSWIVLSILSLISAIGVFAETMLVPAIPDIIEEFHLEYDDSTWIVSAFLISGAVMTPISGRLSDIYGKERVLIALVIVYGFGILIGGFSNSWEMFILARVLQGIGISVIPVALGIISVIFPRDKIAIGQGLITTMAGSGGVIGFTIGGHIIERYGWEATFLMLNPITIALIVLILRYIHIRSEEEEEEEENDYSKSKNLDNTSIDIDSGNIDEENNNDISDTNIHGKFAHTYRQIKKLSNWYSLKIRNLWYNRKWMKIDSRVPNGSSSDIIPINRTTKKKTYKDIDFKGAMALILSVTFFLIVITNFQAQSSSSSSLSPPITSPTTPSILKLAHVQILFTALSIISLVFFVIFERRNKDSRTDLSSRSQSSKISSFSTSLNSLVLPSSLSPSSPPSHSSTHHLPLVDFNLFQHNNTILLPTISLIVAGFLFYTIIHVVPILARSPEPFGYGMDASDTGMIMLPLALSTLIIGPITGLIISKVRSGWGLVIGSITTSLAFLLITLFFLDEFLFSMLAALLNIGYLFVTVSAINMIILSTPKNIMGTTLGVSSLLKFIGGGIGPAIAAMYMHTHLTFTSSNTSTATAIASNSNEINNIVNFVPSSESYLAIFFYSTIISLIGLAIATILSKKYPKCQHHMAEERGEIGPISRRIIKELTTWDLVNICSHPFGGVDIRVKKKSIGHIHGDKLIDLPIVQRSSKMKIEDEKKGLFSMKEAKKSNDKNVFNKSEKYNENIVYSEEDKEESSEILLPRFIYKETGWMSYSPRSLSDVPVLIHMFRARYDN